MFRTTLLALFVFWTGHVSAQTSLPTSQAPMVPLVQPTEMNQPFDFQLLTVEVPFELVSTIATGHPVSIMAVSPSGSLLATVATSGDIVIRDLATKNVQTLEISKRYDVTVLQFSPDSRWLVAGGSLRTDSGFFTLFEANSWKSKTVERGDPIVSVGFSPDGALFHTVTQSGRIACWDLQLKRRLVIETYEGHERRTALASTFNPDGTLLTVLVGPEKRQLVRRVVGDETLAGNRIISHSVTNGAKVSVRSFPAIREQDGRQEPKLVALATGELVAYGDHLLVTRRVNGEIVLQSMAAKPNSVAFSPNGKLGVVAYSDGLVEFWRVGKKEASWLQPAHPESVNVVAFTGDGKQFITGAADGAIKIWRIK